MLIPSVSPNSTSLPSFVCVCTPVSEIHEFNQKKKKKKKKKKKMNNSRNSYFQFNPFPIVEMYPFFDKT